jgi:hypothetical protein
VSELPGPLEVRDVIDVRPLIIRAPLETQRFDPFDSIWWSVIMLQGDLYTVTHKTVSMFAAFSVGCLHFNDYALYADYILTQTTLDSWLSNDIYFT